METFFQRLSQALLFFAIFYAPWAYGCTTWLTELVLILILGAAVFFWLLSSLFKFHIPRVSLLLLVIIIFILGFGWFMSLNGHLLHDDMEMKFIPIASLWPSLPGSLEKLLSLDLMPRITVFLAIIPMVSDLSQDADWRRKIFISIGLAGCSIALWGILQRAFQATKIFWAVSCPDQTFFSTFYYHANAGAYMNLTLPLVAGLWISAMQREKQYLRRAFWAAGVLLMVIATLVNTSRGAGMVAAFLCISFLLWQKNFFLRLLKRVPRLMLFLGGSLCMIIFVALAVSAGLFTALERWQKLPSQISNLGERLSAHQAWLHILPASGFWGAGPGTFRAISSYFKHYGDAYVQYLWWHQAHQDYLQTLIEWGYLGAFFWAILFFGAIFCALHYLRKPFEITGLTNRLLLGSMTLALLGVMLHANYDFPLQICSIQFYVAIFLGIMWGSALGWKKRGS